MSDCEWNPTEHRPAFDTDPPHGEAKVAVGSDGKWFLCESCAALTEFKRFTRRRMLWRRSPARVVRRMNRQRAIEDGKS